MPVNLPTNLLRSFVAIVDTGTMISAAEQVFVSQSALSLQVRRLEEALQQELFTREGRRLALTPAGAVLLDYARRVLALHDEAVAAVTVGRFAGPVRIGMVQDFADVLLAGVLAGFAELHPGSHIHARVAGTAELLALVEKGELDIVVGFGAGDDPSAMRKAPMRWYGEGDLVLPDVVPLAVLDKPCRFREAAIASLDAAGRAYRIAVETPNLSTLQAAVHARLGITCRTDLFRPSLAALPEGVLPPLPEVTCVVATARQMPEAPARLATLVREALRTL